ncbi:hypothetical protein A7A08_01709 [Methyloligella halotolerans]|uniref:Gene transfer agent family protein n=1 Tax=Methyloligella halotolerans TaxID=1177755 RepID=A0A1E2RZN3_9HYPH|nr:GTA-gp10 family protein [Methyloligella halotolerans]ODA67674.1 hypothetical protein A7A08_01709 [Methyloligella halotolerans]
MANPHRGGVPLKAGDTTYTLSFSHNALCELEDALDQSIAAIIDSFGSGDLDMRRLRTLVWAGLRDHHKEMGLEDAGDVASAAGLEATAAAIGEAFQLAMPEQKAGAKENPPKAAKA